jgi:putative transposase
MSSKYDPNIHHRRSIRLPGYDYSEEGWYFVTVCVQNRLCLLGDITENRMQLYEAGLMIEVWWRKLGGKFPNVQTDEYVVMPNHFHGIVSVGAAPCGRPDADVPKNEGVVPQESGQPHGVAPTIGDIVSWFKTMTTNHYIRGVKQGGWEPFFKKLWQRNYYEHVIRNEKELNHFRQYIANNPANWQTDEENPETLRRGGPTWPP